MIVKTFDSKKYTNKIEKHAFQKDLINWYDAEKRDLPWRADQDPYKIWVSEIMLQQTKVDTVIPYFQNFITSFPTLNDLAEAEEEKVLKAWEGLGYYSRARNLQAAVREVVEVYESKVPDQPDLLGELKGVGPYTKGAILSIAYEKPEPAVDGNVMRVFSRILAMDDDIANQQTRKKIESCVTDLISHEDPSAFNQGLMELGATVCTPKKPTCLLCPVQEHCQAFEQGIQESLPVKSKAKKQKSLEYFALVFKDENEKYILEKRPETGLLANMWQFIMIDKSEVQKKQLPLYVREKYGWSIKGIKELSPVKHVFSHITWHLTVLEVELEGEIKTEAQASLMKKEKIKELPLPVSHQKIFNQIT
ncbi:A/G-specific adenine glycosylase [Saliterribacillus persicus]|uniref:Adenine DNA glycosylase n=1 Tax=Saliterribacillus persicus TaxID=930114 RepID=A0A368X4V1_9BACI|nr:A/G-specific adenine glycosylase [Saliterribacillus persicus]RCW62835.1 A/G-specific DNA-adenine glycosylase [Saliterribacillus persicus]